MESGTKTMRADARRNREKLLSSALDLFTEQGADVSLDAVAKHAGVGVGRSTATSPRARPWSRRPT